MPAMNRNRLLLLEDDAVSLAFLREALAPLHADVDVALTCAQAEAAAMAGHDLWLFDAHLPDGASADLLAKLRARGLATPALALTAGADATAHAGLLDAGFARVLGKPLDGAALRRAVLDALPPRDGPWDDARALSALGGRVESLVALRGLFLRDLPAQLADVRAAATRGDADAARAGLHRLHAGCGFVGAAGLLRAVATLQSQPLSATALEAFLDHGERLLRDA